MEIRKCGRTDLMLSRLSLGCLYLSDMGTGAFEDSRESTYYALDKGINFIDTAPSYGNSEMMLGHVLRGYSGKTPMISTKIGHAASVQSPVKAGDPRFRRKEYERHRLRCYRSALYS